MQSHVEQTPSEMVLEVMAYMDAVTRALQDNKTVAALKAGVVLRTQAKSMRMSPEQFYNFLVEGKNEKC